MDKTHSYIRKPGQLAWMGLPLVLAGVAAAATPTDLETTEIRVHYDRRDLDTAAGVHRLLLRIGNAALESCGASRFSLPEFRNATMASQCFKDAVDEAVRRIGSPLLSAAAGEDRH